MCYWRTLSWKVKICKLSKQLFCLFVICLRSVDLVYGHSAHVFQGIEVYRQRPILYDTGDFLDDYAIDAKLRNDWSFVFLLDVEGARMQRLRLRPVRLTYAEVNFAAGDELEAIRRRMRALCGEFLTPMEDTEEGLEITF